MKVLNTMDIVELNVHFMKLQLLVECESLLKQGCSPYSRWHNSVRGDPPAPWKVSDMEVTDMQL